MSSEVRHSLARDVVEFHACNAFVLEQRTNAGTVPEPRGTHLGPGLNPIQAELPQCRRRLLLSNPHFALCERSAMRSFHLPRHFVVALFGGFAHQLAVKLEFVPIHVSAFVDAHFSPVQYRFSASKIESQTFAMLSTNSSSTAPPDSPPCLTVLAHSRWISLA